MIALLKSPIGSPSPPRQRRGDAPNTGGEGGMMTSLQYILLGMAAASDICAFALSIKPLENTIFSVGAILAVAILELSSAIRGR